MLNITATSKGVCFEVRVQPRSSGNQICGEVGGCLKVKLTAPPVDGLANRGLITFLADYLNVSRSRISIARGETSRQKLIEIAGVDTEWIRSKLDQKESLQ